MPRSASSKPRPKCEQALPQCFVLQDTVVRADEMRSREVENRPVALREIAASAVQRDSPMMSSGAEGSTNAIWNSTPSGW